MSAASIAKAVALRIWDLLTFCAAVFAVGALVGAGVYTGCVLWEMAFKFLRGGL
jgi:hypothetical protein